MNTISKISLCLIELFLGISLYASAPTYMQDMYRSFPAQYQHLSPLHGAMMWESGTIRNYFDTSAHIEAPANEWLPKIDGALRLTHALFTDTQGNFDISQNPNYPARHLGFSTLGNIIVLLEEKEPLNAATLEDIIIRDPAFIQSINLVRTEHDDTKKKFEQLASQPELSLQTALVPYSKNFALNKLKMQRLHRDWTRTQQITTAQTRIAEIEQLTGKEKSRAQKELAELTRQLKELQSTKGEGDYNRVRELAQAIIDAHTPSGFYPDNIAQWILLACMYRKAKSKTDFTPYCSLLKTHLRIQFAPIFTRQLYIPVEPITMQQQIKQVEEGTPGALQTYEDIAITQMVERYYRGPFPKIAEYANIVINGIIFPDCVEATLMNLCNMATYDRPSGTFQLDRIPQEHRSKLLLDFYSDQTNRQATNINVPTVHQQWGGALQDLPLVTYRRQIIQTKNGQCTVLSAPKDCNGFIHGLPSTLMATLPHRKDRNDYVQIAGRWYIHPQEPHGYFCEMHPTMRNIIIVLNRLFNLNLFTDKTLEEAFLSDEFNAKYLPRLCDNFSLLRHKAWPKEILQSFDLRDYTEQGIRIAFDNFDLVLTDDHAEIIANTQGSSIADLAPILLKHAGTAKDPHQKWRLAQLASIFPFDIQHIPEKDSFAYLLYLPLYNIQTKIHAAAYCIHKMIDPALHEDDADHYAKLAISCIRRLPERLDWQYHTDLINMLTEEQLKHPAIQYEVTRILKIARDRLNGSPADYIYIPELYSILIAKNQPVESIIEGVDYLLAKTNEFDRKPLLQLLIVLAKRGQAIPQARKAIGLCINNSIEDEMKLAQQLQDSIKEIK